MLNTDILRWRSTIPKKKKTKASPIGPKRGEFPSNWGWVTYAHDRRLLTTRWMEADSNLDNNGSLKISGTHKALVGTGARTIYSTTALRSEWGHSLSFHGLGQNSAAAAAAFKSLFRSISVIVSFLRSHSCGLKIKLERSVLFSGNFYLHTYFFLYSSKDSLLSFHFVCCCCCFFVSVEYLKPLSLSFSLYLASIV